MPTIKKQSIRKKRVVRSKSVVDRIAPIHFDDDDGISLGLYGKSGKGKTTLWSTFPKPILAIICSGIRNSGELRSIYTAANQKVIKCVSLLTTNEIVDLIEHQRATNKYRTVVLDHGSGLQDMNLKEILGLQELPAQGSWGMASREDWGKCTLQVKELLREILSLSCNRVIVTQERVFESEDEDGLINPYVSFGLTPALANWLEPTCDYVCQMFMQQKTTTKQVKIGKKVIEKVSAVKGVDYCLRTAPNPTFAAKFRIPKGGKLPEYIADPTYDKIYKLIQQGGQ